jgi:hypothetical protein
MANRNWRVSGNFHRIGELVVIVEAPNLIAGVRKGALAIKKLPQFKGRRVNSALFSIQESAEAPTVAATQIALAETPSVILGDLAGAEIELTSALNELNELDNQKEAEPLPVASSGAEPQVEQVEQPQESQEDQTLSSTETELEE